MKQFRPAVLPLGLLAVLHELLPAQQTNDSPTLSPDRVHAATMQFAALQELDGELVGAGRDYRARFDAAGAQFVPACGEAAPTEYPVTLRGVAYGRGVADLPLAEIAPSHRDHTVTFAHGAVAETYEVRHEGLEQSFVFDALPAGAGDLVVRVHVATALPVTSDGADAVTYGNEFGGVRIAGVVGIDARGARVAGSIDRAGDTLTLRLPAAFVDHAALPLVLDPLIGSTFPVYGTGQDLDPSIAYDADLDLYLVVWWRRYSALTGDIYGQYVFRVQTGGAELSGSSAVYRTGFNSQRARVADCALRNAFVVGWQEVVATPPLPSYRDLYARAVTPTVYSSALSVTPTPLIDARALELAGESGGNGYVTAGCLTANNAYLRQINVSAAIQLSLASPVPVTVSGTPATLRLPKSTGTTGRYLVATLTTAGAGRIQAYTGLTAVGTARTIPGSNVQGVALDGDGSDWTVAWAELESGSTTSRNVRACAYHWDPAIGSLVQNGLVDVAATAGVDEVLPAVAVTGRAGVVAWIQASATRELRMRTFTLGTCWACEPSLTIATSTADLIPAIAAQQSGAETAVGSRRDLLLAWQADNGSASPISAARWTPADGSYTVIGASCGGLTATNADECARNGSALHRALLLNPPAGASGWLIVSTDRRDVTGCGSCVLVPDPWNAVMFSGVTGAFGDRLEVALPIAASTYLIGFSYYQQWLVADAVSPGCSFFPFDFSDALKVVIQ